MKQKTLFENAYSNEDHGRILKTQDYNVFNYINGNRNIIPKNVLKLAQDIRQKGQIDAVLVDDKMFVLDGQHRIAACKKLRLPVKFVIAPTNGLSKLEYVKSVNTVRRNWDWRQYLDMYCIMENAHYINYRKLLNRYNFDHTAMLSVVSFSAQMEGSRPGTLFNKGELKIKNIESVIDRLDNISQYWNKVSRIYASVPNKNKNKPSSKLVKAFIKLMKHPKFDHGIMLQKLNNDIRGLLGINSIDGFVGELTKIYNYRNRTNIINFD